MAIVLIIYMILCYHFQLVLPIARLARLLQDVQNVMGDSSKMVVINVQVGVTIEIII